MRNFFVGIVLFLLLLNQPTIVLATAKADLASFKANRVALFDTKGLRDAPRAPVKTGKV